MPVLRAPVVLAPNRHYLRHVGPVSTVWPGSFASVHNFLARNDFVARPLTNNALPDSPDLASGTFTLRLGDAGEGTAVFPNSVASDGVPWRSRFDPTYHLEWLEFWSGGELDQVGVIDTANPDQQQVQVHVYDGFWLCKKAYERDWIVTWAPRDVIIRGCSLWVAPLADQFQGASLGGNWTVVDHGGGSMTGSAHVRQSGGLVIQMTGPITSSEFVTVTDTTRSLLNATGVWRSIATIGPYNLPATETARFRLQITESDGTTYAVVVAGTAVGNTGTLISSELTNQVVTSIPSSGNYTLQLESDGTWIWAFVNGLLVGVVKRADATTTTIQTQLALLTTVSVGGAPCSVTVDSVLTETQQPYLQSSSDAGDYVLPGTASTYPWGGLHGRYFNDLDLPNDGDRLLKIMSPDRSQAYGNSSAAEYANQMDAPITGSGGSPLQNPQPGAASSNWSVTWFGSIWLQWTASGANIDPGSAGHYTFQFAMPAGANTAIKVWVGTITPGNAVISQWSWQSGMTFTATISGASLAGNLPYGQGSTVRTGWYPIKIEYAVDGTNAPAPTFSITNSPAAYTDPGGTSWASGTQSTVVPATSLSPLGMMDQRYQAISHFDLIQQTAQAVGYQFAVEPKQLESGLFPGVLVPRIQEGHNTDVVLEPDQDERHAGEGILNYSSQLDATDTAGSMWGNGAGTQTGGGGQLQGLVWNSNAVTQGLFDPQGWNDFSDVAFPELLQASLTAMLDLRLTPWQLLSADPMGRPRYAFNWPLTGQLQTFRWRAGDGLFIRAPSINIYDTIPRQMLVYQRSFVPEGIIQATATFAARSKGAAYQIRQEMFKIRRWQRNYQKRLTTLPSNAQVSTIGAGATDSNSVEIILHPRDNLKELSLRVTDNSGGVPFGVQINGTPVTGTPEGPWKVVPVVLNLTAWYQEAVTAGGFIHVVAQLINSGGSSSTFHYQLFADVRR